MSQPDPNPVMLSLPWGEDLQLTPNGSLVFVSGVEKVQQRIIRRYFTNPEETLSAGMYVPADNIFDPGYGIGASKLIGEPIDNALANKLQQKILNAVLVDESVDSTQQPVISLYAAPSGEVWANVQVTLLDATTTYLNFPAR